MCKEMWRATWARENGGLFNPKTTYEIGYCYLYWLLRGATELIWADTRFSTCGRLL